jgi:hypothetical protein
VKRFLFIFTLLCSSLFAQSANVARVVMWQPKPDVEQKFEEGYKRHLEWHRAHQDRWTWLGWNIVSGDRSGMFVDASAFHPWPDLDSPVAPKEDAADNATNVYPYGDVRSVVTYEAVSGATRITAAQLQSPLLDFVYLDVAPGSELAFEQAALKTLSSLGDAPRVLFRPANGGNEYLLLLPAAKMSDLQFHAGLLREILHASSARPSNHSDSGYLVRRYHTELARFRPDMSYIP